VAVRVAAAGAVVRAGEVAAVVVVSRAAAVAKAVGLLEVAVRRG
jgi:hypothetical protein